MFGYGYSCHILGVESLAVCNFFGCWKSKLFFFLGGGGGGGLQINVIFWVFENLRYFLGLQNEIPLVGRQQKLTCFLGLRNLLCHFLGFKILSILFFWGGGWGRG